MQVEEQYLDVLQNIEFSIIQVYREHRDLLDSQVNRSLEAMIEFYSAQNRNRDPRDFKLSDQEGWVYEAIKAMCEWRLGRAKPEGTKVTLEARSALTTDEILLCLKRLRKSVQKWSKHQGRQGYLNFVNEFIH